MSFIKKTMNGFRKFTMVDAMFFELYLFAMGIVVAKLIPAVLGLNIWLYVGLLIIGLTIIIPSVFKKKMTKRSMMKNYRNLNVWKLGVYKILVLVASFTVLKLIPIMMTVDIVWYVAVAFFGMGYLMAAIYRK